MPEKSSVDQAQPAKTSQTGRKQTNIFAILALIFAFLFPILGIVFGLVALHQIKKSGEEGRGLALAGIIISLIFFIIATLFILIGAVAFLGVLSPERFIPHQCITPAGLACVDFVAAESGVALVLQNRVGADITGVQVTMDGCSPSQPQDLASGNEGTFTSSCSGLILGQNVERDFTITYTDASSGLDKAVQGSLITQVEDWDIWT